MKFSARAGDLTDALSTVVPVIPKAPSLSVFSGVKLAVRAGQLTVTGSSEGETTVTVTVPVTDAAAGAVVLLPGPIAAYLGTLPARSDVTVSAGDPTKVEVVAGGGNPYTFRAMDATFPVSAASSADTTAADLSRLHGAVAAVKDCAKANKVVQLISDDTGIRLHATDGVRLARAHLPEAGFGPFSGLLPLDVTERLANTAVTSMGVDRRGRVLTAASDTTTIVTRLLDEAFPTVDTVLAAVPPYTVDVDTAALRAALARLRSVAETKRPVVVCVAGDELTLQVDSINIGSGAERIELETPAAAEVRFGVNLDYLASAAASHSSTTVTLGWSGPSAAVFLTSTEPLAVTNVVMPVRLTD